MNSKIKSIEFKNEWANPKGGSIFYHTISFENGDSGQIGAKSKLPEKLKVGESLEYEIKIDEKGNKKVIATPLVQGVFKASQMPKNNEATQRAIIAQNALSNAVKRYEGCKDVSNELVVATAEYFYKWVLDISKI